MNTQQLFSNGRSFFMSLGLASFLLSVNSCGNKQASTEKKDEKIRIITLDPGHFHAALLQKSMYNEIDSVVHVYAPDGTELDNHMKLVESYNTRNENPTAWKHEIYRGADYLEKMFSDKAGNVVIISGNNKLKTNYISRSIDSGLNVLADKPLAINQEGFKSLEKAFSAAKDKNVLLYDIMTERFNVYYVLQRALSQDTTFFGALEKGTPDNPAVEQRSVHHFYKNVSGKPLVRPAWFFDVEQEGRGLVDITTHMVDLIQWGCFPDITLDYKKDINMISAREWSTQLSLEQFQKSTLKDKFPDYLTKYIKDGKLNVMSNGEMNYSIKGVHARVGIQWNYEAPAGTGDTHFARMRGTKANILIKQGKEQNYKPVVYLEVPGKEADAETKVKSAIDALQAKWPGVSFKKSGNLWEVIIPEKYKVPHEEHFAEVVKNYLNYIKGGKLPDWEIPNMLAKYYTTTKAAEIAKGK
ncbi:putative oxidoreductase C-terminal domain-containing protein [Daejeonella sp. H1SJ63]|jgi:predicted dehydrogenase|uniref:putative oxidoreductase C-terminal domain-containing protein n=1 Tax=Daejeonella sp. H1SJ63 TaxID=3034145 RepID=UPI0023ED4CD8|nr:putative oxidoreductase C-terminal domain-containing protein [Daejeonella sp. H1SJ63]